MPPGSSPVGLILVERDRGSDAGAIDADVQSPVGRDMLLEGVDDIPRVGHVALHEDGGGKSQAGVELGIRLLDEGGHLLSPVFREVDHRHEYPLLRERYRQSLTDARSSAGDESGQAGLELHGWSRGE